MCACNFLADVILQLYTANDIMKAEFLELSKLQERARGETVRLSSAELKSRHLCVNQRQLEVLVL